MRLVKICLFFVACFLVLPNSFCIASHHHKSTKYYPPFSISSTSTYSPSTTNVKSSNKTNTQNNPHWLKVVTTDTREYYLDTAHVYHDENDIYHYDIKIYIKPSRDRDQFILESSRNSIYVFDVEKFSYAIGSYQVRGKVREPVLFERFLRMHLFDVNGNSLGSVYGTNDKRFYPIRRDRINGPIESRV